ncbi:hypothetical protein SRABI102_01595 [Stenotrophomonas lactitubi]|nr:hypothetical protein SRABI81_01338 [Stenotrophomonas lactitubi]CAH0176134.1 hypothetical protein SRABI122_01306 [Stenotrophomonas lactitubi]CAH0194289.1 hypothetical protein SRABI102_01595 [Stenotrophomonas lactitubi]CAH0228766.1 hypothetical protein SRABI66_02634 [Stenotrophomonas lactitubi]
MFGTQFATLALRMNLAMPKYSAHAIFCDDVRREQGGAMSLMGVYGSVAQRVATHPLRLGCVVVINCEIGEDISGLKVELIAHTDGSPLPVVNAFPSLPAGKTRPDAVTQALIDRFDGDPPGGAPTTTMVGILQAEGIQFDKSCVFSAQIDGAEIGRLVFFKQETVSSAGSSSPAKAAKRMKSAARSEGLVRKVAAKRKKAAD